MRTARFGGGGGGGGAVSSVFGRIGAVVATLGDYAASLITNDSGVAGATVKAALDTLNAKLPNGSAVGQALIWGGAAWAAGVDFGAQVLTTTGGFIGNAGAAFLRVGLAPGSGAGVASASSTGNIRGARGAGGFLLAVRNEGDTADLTVLKTDTVGGGIPFVVLGDFNAGGLSGVVSAPVSGIAKLTVGFNALAQLTSTAFTLGGISLFQFASNSVLPVISQAINGVAGGVGNKLSIFSQPCTGGGGSIGGDLDIGPGRGDTPGLAKLVGDDFTKPQRLAWNITGLGLYTATPVAQASRVGQLTDSTTGTPATTLVDVGAVPTQASCNNNFASLLTKLNAVELALHNLGVTA